MVAEGWCSVGVGLPYRKHIQSILKAYTNHIETIYKSEALLCVNADNLNLFAHGKLGQGG